MQVVALDTGQTAAGNVGGADEWVDNGQILQIGRCVSESSNLGASSWAPVVASLTHDGASGSRAALVP